MLLTPTKYKILISKLDLIDDAQELIEKFLQIRVTNDMVDKAFTELYDSVNSQNMAKNISFINQTQYQLNFDSNGTYTFGNLIIKLLCNMYDTHNNNASIDIVEKFTSKLLLDNNSFENLTKNDILIESKILSCRKFFSNVRMNTIDVLFAFTFAQNMFTKEIFETKIEQKDIPNKNIQKFCLDILNRIIFDKNYRICIMESEYSSCEENFIQLEIENKNLDISMMNILNILCFWTDTSFYPLLFKMIMKIEYYDNDSNDFRIKSNYNYHIMKCIIEKAINNNGFLLLNSLKQNEMFRNYCWDILK